MVRYSQQLLQLFDLPSGLVVGYKRRAAADRVVKFHISVGNRSRYTFIFPRTTYQGSVLSSKVANTLSPSLSV